MIMHGEDCRSFLVAPQFARRGPYAPGETVLLEVPLTNESEETLHDLTMRLVSDMQGVRVDPAMVEIDEIAAGQTRRFPAHVTFPERLPDSIHSTTAKVWGVLDPGTGSALQTAFAEATIETRAKIVAEIVDQTLLIENTGSADALLQLDGDVALPASWPQQFSLRAKAIANPLDLPNVPIGPIRISNVDTGERVVVLHRRVLPTGPSLEAIGRVLEQQAGVRSGDSVDFEVEIHNSGSMAYDARLDLPALEGVTLADGCTKRDGIPLLPQDIACSEDTWSFSIGAIPSGGRTVVRSAMRIIDPPSGLDVLEWFGSVSAQGTRAAVRFGVQLLQSPLVATHGTFFGPLVELENGMLSSDVVITNPHQLVISGASLAISVRGARVISLVDAQEKVFTLSADALGEAGTIAELGEIAAQSRARYTLTLARLPGAQRVEASVALIAGGKTTPLATMAEELLLEPKPTIELVVPQGSRLCRGAPLHVKVKISNDGTDALRGARVRADFPPGVEIEFPHDGGIIGEWRAFSYPFPAEIKMELPAVLTLTEPPESESVSLGLEIDGDNSPLVTSQRVEIATPASPLLICSEPQFFELEERGLVEVRVRVMNRSDGVARNVVLSVPNEDNPVAFTATIGGRSVDERSHGRRLPILIEGLNLGDLKPKSQCDVAWLASPGGSFYSTTVTVRADGGIERRVRGSFDARERQHFASSPPPTEPIDESKPIAGVKMPKGSRSNDASDSLALGTSSVPARIERGVRQAQDEATGEVIALDGTHDEMLRQPAAATTADAVGGDRAGSHPERLLEQQRPNPGEQPAASTPTQADADDGLVGLLNRIGVASPASGGADDGQPFVAEPPVASSSQELSQFDRLDALVAEAQARTGGFVEHDGSAGEQHGADTSELDVLVDDVVRPEVEAEASAPTRDEIPESEPVKSGAHSTISNVVEPTPGMVTDFGFAQVKSLLDLAPPDSRSRALMQALAMRLIGSPEYERISLARKVLMGRMGEFASARGNPEKLEAWCKDTIRRIDEAIANSNTGGSVADAIADNDAVAPLSWIEGILPDVWRESYQSWRIACEDRFPLNEQSDIAYPTLLWSTHVPEVDEAITALLKVVTG